MATLSLEMASCPPRGVGWVLRWAFVSGMFTLTGIILLGGGYLIAAERWLGSAAASGVREAALPQATLETITHQVDAQLRSRVASLDSRSIWLEVGGRPALSRWRVRPGDPVAVTVAIPTSAVLPRWLAWVNRWLPSPPLRARAERIIPASCR